MKTKNRAAHLILALILTLFIISISVVGTLAFRPLYYADIHVLNIPETSGYSEEEIRENYDALIDYNMSFEKGMLDFPTLPQSDGAQFHFYEVKNIFDLFKYMGMACFVLSAAGIFLFAKKKMGRRYLKYTSILAVGIPAFLGAFVGANWDWAFVTFHHIAFNNDFWLFDPATDPVITMLPDEFFLHCAVMILGLVVLGSVICLVLYKRGKRKN